MYTSKSTLTCRMAVPGGWASVMVRRSFPLAKSHIVIWKTRGLAWNRKQKTSLVNVTWNKSLMFKGGNLTWCMPHLSFSKATKQTRAVMVNAQGWHCAVLCPCRRGTQTEPQRLVLICNNPYTYNTELYPELQRCLNNIQRVQISAISYPSLQEKKSDRKVAVEISKEKHACDSEVLRSGNEQGVSIKSQPEIMPLAKEPHGAKLCLKTIYITHSHDVACCRPTVVMKLMERTDWLLFPHNTTMGFTLPFPDHSTKDTANQKDSPQKFII